MPPRVVIVNTIQASLWPLIKRWLSILCLNIFTIQKSFLVSYVAPNRHYKNPLNEWIQVWHLSFLLKCTGVLARHLISLAKGQLWHAGSMVCLQINTKLGYIVIHTKWAGKGFFTNNFAYLHSAHLWNNTRSWEEQVWWVLESSGFPCRAGKKNIWAPSKRPPEPWMIILCKWVYPRCVANPSPALIEARFSGPTPAPSHFVPSWGLVPLFPTPGP